MPNVPVQFESVEARSGSAAKRSRKKPQPVIYATNHSFEQSLYFGEAAPQWNALEADPQATLIKNGRQRKIWRLVLPKGLIVFAKVFDDPVGPTLSCCKRLVRLHPLMREWNALMRLQSLGVSAVRPIAMMGYPPSVNAASSQPAAVFSRRMVLLTEGLEHARTLVVAWNAVRSSDAPRVRTTQTRILTSAVAELWAQAHSRGYSHPDGHPGNVLIEHDASKEGAIGRAEFIDPALSIRRPVRLKPVSKKEALVSLAMLDQYFHRSATRAERLRFWRDYWVRRDVLLNGSTERRLLCRLAEFASTHHAALARKRDRRLQGDGKYFGWLCLSDGWRATVVLQLERRHVYGEAEVPDRSVEQWASLCLHALRVDPPQVLVEKGLRLVRRPVNHRGSWAEDLFRRSHRLRHRDIPAPLILGFLQNRGMFGVRDEYLILPSGQRPQTP